MISLHAICGNESVHAERFIRAFAPAVDEICIARAVGETNPDDTIGICNRVCRELGVKFLWTEYRNQHPFPHVDNFAAARNTALELTSGGVITWADFDDTITEETAEQIRKCSEAMLSGSIEYTRPEGAPEPHKEDGVEAMQVFARYDLATQGESNMRERLFTRSCRPQWTGALHENLHPTRPAVSIVSSLTWSHQPKENHAKDIGRNLRILTAATEHFDHYAFERGRQEFIDWNQSEEKSETGRRNTRKWLGIALADQDCIQQRRYQGKVMLAAIDRWQDADTAKGVLWEAVRLMPEQRDAYHLLADIELECGNPTRALCVWLAGIAQRRPAASGFQLSERLYGWAAADMLCRCRRACGENPQESLDKQAEDHGGYRVALVHKATDARRAMVTRNSWHESAFDPARVYHVFHCDDPETAAELRRLGASVADDERAAWFVATSREIPVLSVIDDDWIPCMNWDFFVWQSMEEASKGIPVSDVPLWLDVESGEAGDPGPPVFTHAHYRSHGAVRGDCAVDGTHVNFRNVRRTRTELTPVVSA